MKDYEQRIVGTWEGSWYKEHVTFVFNADGTGTSSGFSPEFAHMNGNTFWGVSASGNLVVYLVNKQSDNKTFGGEVYLSPEDKRMIWNQWVYQKK